MIYQELLQELEKLIRRRQIGPGIALLDRHREAFEQICPGEPLAGTAMFCLAEWLDVGFDDHGALAASLPRFHKGIRSQMPLGEYLHLRLAEGVAEMRREDLTAALQHLDAALALAAEVENAHTLAVGYFWKARCMRKAGDYDRALDIAQKGRELSEKIEAPHFAGVIRTLESWLHFQKGSIPDAIRLLTEAEAILRDTDDFITLGNIQSSYGRIALREGRFDHALQYFASSIACFKHRPSLEGYLARSLTNMAQSKRLLALQLRRSLDADWERQRKRKENGRASGSREKAAQRERMHELLRDARTHLDEAGVIYARMHNYHGSGNVDVYLAQIYLDLGDLDQAWTRASEALELGSTKADHVLMCRARIGQTMIANARFEEQIGETGDPSRFAQLAHDCAKEAVRLSEQTESRRLRAEAQICQAATLINGFFQNTEEARACCDRADAYLNHERHDPLFQELEALRARIVRAGFEDPNFVAWSQGAIGDKSLQDVVGEFEELLIRRVWERENRKVSRVAHRLAVSPKKVRRVLRHLGLLGEQDTIS